MPVEWTSEKLAKLSMQQVENLRENARGKCDNAIVALCDGELEARKPAKPTRDSVARNKGAVVGYHLVCRPEEKGSTRNKDGTVWSGTWVVAEKQAQRSLKNGAYVALHASHSDRSYLHGIIKGFRRTKREDAYAEGQKVKTPVGTDFLLEITNQSVEWRGAGTVERSYVYSIDQEPTA